MMKNFNSMVSNFVANKSRNTFVNKSNSSPFINAIKRENNYTTTTNGATALKSTGSKLYDLFSLGGAYRARSEEDCILLFKEAYLEDHKYALKCLAYLRDIESQGQGERRFFRVVLKWLASFDIAAIKCNLETLVRDNYCRWDDIFVLFDTPAEDFAMDLIRKQLTEDIKAYNSSDKAPISLCAKWCSSINSSSAKTKAEGRRIAHALGLTERQYRKMLSKLRERINVLERLMSQNRWMEIEFDKIPSRAGLIYRNCFKNKGLIAEKYRNFATSSETKVNAGKLYPYDIVAKAEQVRYSSINDTERLMINKYWDNLTDFFNGAESNAMVVCDTSGSMTWGANGTATPMQVAVSLAIYAAERANGPFKNHYISFSSNARLVEVRGVDFVDKVKRIEDSNVCENTNLESVFDLVLNTAMQRNLRPSALPETLIIISDQQVDRCAGIANNKELFMDSMRRKWYKKCNGKYEFPSIVMWNVNASKDSFLSDSKSGITFVSGCSPTLFTQVATGVTAEKLMYQVLDSERYAPIH